MNGVTELLAIIPVMRGQPTLLTMLPNQHVMEHRKSRRRSIKARKQRDPAVSPDKLSQMPGKRVKRCQCALMAGKIIG